MQVKNKSQLEAELRRAGDKHVLMDFYATWCVPCIRIEPLVKQIATKHKDNLVLIKIDVDEVEDLVGEYGIEVMPTFVLRRCEAKLGTVVGANEQKLCEMVARHLGKK